MQRGVVIPKNPNPLKKITFDRRRQLPFDTLHQDALASTVVFHQPFVEAHASVPNERVRCRQNDEAIGLFLAASMNAFFVGMPVKQPTYVVL